MGVTDIDIDYDEQKRRRAETGRWFEAEWAWRILRCPTRRCRRAGACLRPTTCPALERWPLPEALMAAQVKVVRAMLEERVAAAERGPEAKTALFAEWKRAGGRRRRHAMRNGRRELGRGAGE